MFCTEDFEIMDIVKQTDYSGIVRVGVRISQDIANAFFKADERGISTRSRLARMLSDFYILDESPMYKDGVLTAKLGYRNLQVPITYQIGDKVGRFYAYNHRERVGANDTETSNSKFVELELEDVRLTVEKHREPVKASHVIANPGKFLRESEHKDWNKIYDEMLLVTEKAEIPHGMFGLIKGITWNGGTYHINSKVIDPGWKGPLVLEINAREDSANFAKPKLVLELYQATNANDIVLKK